MIVWEVFLILCIKYKVFEDYGCRQIASASSSGNPTGYFQVDASG